MEQPAALMQQKLLVSKAGAFISAAIDTLQLEHIGLGGRRKSSCWAVSSRAVCKHQSPGGSIGKFCPWMTASTLNNEVDIPDSELAVESEMLVLLDGRPCGEDASSVATVARRCRPRLHSTCGIYIRSSKDWRWHVHKYCAKCHRPPPVSFAALSGPTRRFRLAQWMLAYAFQHRSAEPMETGWLVTRVAKSCSTFFPEPQ